MKKILKRLSVFFAVLLLSFSWITFSNVGKVEASADVLIPNSIYSSLPDADPSGKFYQGYPKTSLNRSDVSVLSSTLVSEYDSDILAENSCIRWVPVATLFWHVHDIVFYNYRFVSMNVYSSLITYHGETYIDDFRLFDINNYGDCRQYVFNTQSSNPAFNKIIDYGSYGSPSVLDGFSNVYGSCDDNYIDVDPVLSNGIQLYHGHFSLRNLTRVDVQLPFYQFNSNAHLTFNLSLQFVYGNSVNNSSNAVDLNFYTSDVASVGAPVLEVYHLDFFAPDLRANENSLSSTSNYLPSLYVVDEYSLGSGSASEDQLTASFNAGKAQGIEEGKVIGYSNGLSDGRSAGYSQAQQDGEVLKSQTKNFLFTLFDAPVSVFSGLSDLEIFGINFGTVVSVILFTLLLAGIMRFL